MSPSRYRFLGADVNMSLVMVDVGTVESASVMLELDLLGSFFFVVPHATENNSSKSQKKKKNVRGKPNSLLLLIEYADLGLR